jgi:hypothetical protein
MEPNVALVGPPHGRLFNSLRNTVRSRSLPLRAFSWRTPRGRSSSKHELSIIPGKLNTVEKQCYCNINGTPLQHQAEREGCRLYFDLLFRKHIHIKHLRQIVESPKTGQKRKNPIKPAQKSDKATRHGARANRAT